ncbi:MAG TPA: hypothetical protein DHV36_13500 [Desulfobacteraceae bacterium]|nr:hypothetical protein [Desulfobacteraceae bacterium]
MVFDYKILPTSQEILEGPNEIKGFIDRRKRVTRKLKRDRRKAKRDRRKSVRDGVIVNLSFKNDRRKGGDRRRPGGGRRPTSRNGGIRV